MSMALAVACAALVSSHALAEGPNSAAAGAETAAPALHAFNQGHVLCTAAINADGTVFSGDHVNTTLTGGFSGFPGDYQVVFASPCVNITAANGWFRQVQPDLLQIGNVPGAI